jgi:adenosylmethionine-8-amino-7-oxononanoate aminotransferase
MDSKNLFYRDLYKSHVKIVKGEGVYLFDENGRRYIDASGGSNASVPLGHCVDSVIDSMVEQARKIAFVPMHLFSNEPAEKLAELISKITPKGLNYVWFVNSGSEATDNAIKLARQYNLERGKQSKYKVIGRWQSFHGNTLGALSVSGHTFRRSKYLPLLMDMPHIPPANCYRCWFRKEYPKCDIECARILENVIKQEGEESVSAFIAEPIVGATTGATVPPKEYYPIIREICDKYEVLFIADEVQTGFGRTGENFCINHWKVVPDIMTVGKGMSGGYTPIAAVIVKEDIVEQFKRNRSNFVGGHTYSANPLSCAIALKVVEMIISQNLVSKCKESGKYLRSKLEELYNHPIVGDVRGLGLMQGIEFVKEKNTKKPFPRQKMVAQAITEEAMKNGVIVYPGQGTADGVDGDHILLTPPYIITREQIDEVIEAIDKSIKVVETLCLS